MQWGTGIEEEGIVSEILEEDLDLEGDIWGIEVDNNNNIISLIIECNREGMEGASDTISNNLDIDSIIKVKDLNIGTIEYMFNYIFL